VKRPKKDPSFRPTLRTTRLEAFSDGVFAIAITLLVLEISLAPAPGQGLGEALLESWASYLAYATSFFTIGALWLAHSAITEYLRGADPILLRLNLVLLFGVAFLPFPTTLVAEYVDSTGSERIAVTVYGILLILLLVVTWLLWAYGVKAGLLKDEVSQAEVDELSKRLSPAMALYLGAIVLGLVFPVLAVVAYLSIAVLVLMPIRTVYRVLRPRPVDQPSRAA
jgi:uncharacterized membrane protein